MPTFAQTIFVKRESMGVYLISELQVKKLKVY